LFIWRRCTRVKWVAAIFSSSAQTTAAAALADGQPAEVSTSSR
jgi:hypothetical protein